MGNCDPRTCTIRLRPTAPGDLPALFELQTDAESNDMAGTKPRSREAFYAVWERIFDDPGVNSRVIEIDVERGGERGTEIVEVDVFIHHISEFIHGAEKNGLKLLKFDEVWHADDAGKPPRLASFVFGKD